MNEQWCPFAIKRIGRQGEKAKMGYPGGIQGVPADNLMNAPKRGEVKHDSVGPLGVTFGVLDHHPINSWHFTIDEEIYQHYPVDANCWHGNDTDPDDDVRANVELVGVEHTRVNGQMQLTSRQLDLTVQLTRWLMQSRGFSNAVRLYDPNPVGDAWLLTEHNEVGNAPTACPSGRIPWPEIIAAIPLPPPGPVGIGVHYSDGTEEEIWNSGNVSNAFKTLDGIGARWSDGTVRRLWP